MAVVADLVVAPVPSGSIQTEHGVRQVARERVEQRQLTSDGPQDLAFGSAHRRCLIRTRDPVPVREVAAGGEGVGVIRHKRTHMPTSGQSASVDVVLNERPGLEGPRPVTAWALAQ